MFPPFVEAQMAQALSPLPATSFLTPLGCLGTVAPGGDSEGPFSHPVPHGSVAQAWVPWSFHNWEELFMAPLDFEIFLAACPPPLPLNFPVRPQIYLCL
jgi:hypothetical protein